MKVSVEHKTLSDIPRSAEIATDSRTIGPGMWFLALRGENHDGHRFCATAVERGAAGLIVETGFDAAALPRAVPLVQVPDTLRAYGDLAAARRREWAGPVLAMSGSVGKTTTRRLVASALATHYKTLEPIRNYNNLIGVPHTLLRLEPDHQVAVLELGMNQPGELRRLTEIAQPSAALLTRITGAHVGMFDSMAALVDAKLDLLRGCAPGVPWVVNASCPHTMRGLARLPSDHPVITFTTNHGGTGIPADVVVENVTARPEGGYLFDLTGGDRRLEGLELSLFGRHHVENVAAAAALLLAGGYDAGLLAAALPEFRTEPLRGQIVARDGITYILDCYNASPAAMAGALASLRDLKTKRRFVLVLADMLELGADAEAAHIGLTKPILELDGQVCLYALGPLMSRLAGALQSDLKQRGGSAGSFADREALAGRLKGDLRPGDVVFFKGSHGFALEKAAEIITPGLTG